MPAEAVRFELLEHVLDDEVVAELLAGRLLREVVGAVLAPVEGDALFLHEGEGPVDPRGVDPLSAVDDPRLVDLVLGEAVLVQESRPEVAVDHPHRRVAEHQDQRAARAKLGRDLGSDLRRRFRHRRVVADRLLAVTDGAGGAPLVEARHEGIVGGEVGVVGPDPRKRPVEALEARAGVQQPDEPGPLPAEVARQQERVVLAHDAVGGVGPVEPVDADADHRIVDRPELLDRVVRLREEAFDPVRLAAELLYRLFELGRGLTDVFDGELVGLVPGVSGPEECDAGLHEGLPVGPRIL